MAEPAIAGAGLLGTVATGAGITVLGVATGIEPWVLIGAVTGAVWSQARAPGAKFAERCVRIVGGSVLAVIGAPVLAAVMIGSSKAPSGIAHPMLAPGLALLIGYLAHRVIMPGIERLSTGLVDRLVAGKGGNKDA